MNWIAQEKSEGIYMVARDLLRREYTISTTETQEHVILLGPRFGALVESRLVKLNNFDGVISCMVMAEYWAKENGGTMTPENYKKCVDAELSRTGETR